ncbi:MAG TPA: DICT sensory domain-containing protein, partial [Solirubrobacteraceae bacterium]|nr:DICT sensory domain-containing protein [Solirubrobacteraceae bacterium]
ILIGSFQREHFYRHSERRWRELARTADIAVALADFPRRADPPGAPVEIPVPRRQPLAREWTVVVSSDAAQACLAAWEQPTAAARPDHRRPFEVLWSFDPFVVAEAIRVVAELLEAFDPALALQIRARGAASGPGAAAALDQGGALAHRMVGYLGEMLNSAGAGRLGVQG